MPPPLSPVIRPLRRRPHVAAAASSRPPAWSRVRRCYRASLLAGWLPALRHGAAATAVCYRRALLPAAETRLPAAPVRQRCRPCSLLLLRRGLLLRCCRAPPPRGALLRTPAPEKKELRSPDSTFNFSIFQHSVTPISTFHLYSFNNSKFNVEHVYKKC